MPNRKMHADELHTDVGLVRALLEGQFPHWAALPIERVLSSGTVNALYRLGDDMVVRLPRMDWGLGAVDRELRWLPPLAPLLSVEIPVPLAKGAPAAAVWRHGDSSANRLACFGKPNINCRFARVVRDCMKLAIRSLRGLLKAASATVC